MWDECRPRILLSRCIEHDHCRFNGGIVSSQEIKNLKPFVDFVTVCPEVAVGLSVPREAIRMIKKNGKKHLVWSLSGKDITQDMRDFTERYLKDLEDIDGAVLKSRSPTCGIKDVKIYPSEGKVAALGEKTEGMFGGAVANFFQDIPIEDEGRLTNFRIREHFYTRIFTHRRFADLKKNPTMAKLVDFHTRHKYLFMIYSQKELRHAGRVVAGHSKRTLGTALEEYEDALNNIFLKPPRRPSVINVLMHIMGYFSKQLSPEEKAFFLDQLELYREEKIPLSSLLLILRSWIVRFNNDYLKKQVVFEPYPRELVTISDSGKGR
jgi:uncharacterized protein YbgA (DUF1722 family)/uncharacterized protein YbbK (DUF523 family)